MNCVDKKELEQFLRGKLDPRRLIAVDEHISTCGKCKAALAALPVQKNLRAEFGAALLGVQDCPEYEELSAFVEQSLSDDRMRALRSHINLCDLCSRDVARIQELRSHAELRGKITVKPGMNRKPAANPWMYWKHVFAGASLAAVVTAAVFSFGLFSNAPVHKSTHNQFAQRPPVVSTPAPKTQGNTKQNILKPSPSVDNTVKPEHVAKVDTPKPIAIKHESPKPVEPSYVAMLKDGKYQVIRKDGRTILANSKGNSATTSLAARIAANINAKIRTGKVILEKSTTIAMIPGALRSPVTDISPNAPKPISPIGDKIVISAYPTITWSDNQLADSYHVTIYDQSGNQITDEITSKNSFTPSKPLQRGQVYLWRVGVRFSESDPWYESTAARFVVLSAKGYSSIQQVKQNLPGSHLAMGTTYESFGLHDEAVNEYRALAKENPNSKLAKKLLDGTVNPAR